jgi:hypothetical protein
MVGAPGRITGSVKALTISVARHQSNKARNTGRLASGMSIR